MIVLQRVIHAPLAHFSCTFDTTFIRTHSSFFQSLSMVVRGHPEYIPGFPIWIGTFAAGIYTCKTLLLAYGRAPSTKQRYPTYSAGNPGIYCCGGFLGTRRAFPVGGLRAGKRGEGRVNPGETCLPAYSGELVLRKTSVLLGPRVLGR